MYVATESTIYLDEIETLCKNKNGKWDSVFILVPLRLGLGTSINKTYLPQIQQLFDIPQFIGILGGKPRAAYYFVAAQGLN